MIQSSFKMISSIFFHLVKKRRLIFASLLITVLSINVSYSQKSVEKDGSETPVFPRFKNYSAPAPEGYTHTSNLPEDELNKPEYQNNHTDSHLDHYDKLPDLGSSASKYLSDSEAKKLGLSFIRRSRFSLPYVSDPELLNYINDLGDRLLQVSDDAGKDYEFHLIKSDVINAFAVPGGQIALHTAILTKSETEGELASVVAHEISHVTQNHIARNIENSRFDNYIALGALLAAAAAGGAEGAQAGLAVASTSILDKQLRYSRAFESEADALGVRLISRAGFDTNAMPRFFKRLLEDSRLNKSYAPEFLRSHPLTVRRISESAERVRAYPAIKQQNDESRFLMMQAKATASYTKRISTTRSYYSDKIKKGDNSLPTRYGYAITLTRSGEFDKAREVFTQLLKEFPDNASVLLMHADNELEAKNIEQGLAILKSTYEQHIARGDHLIDIYYANALVLTKRNKEAIPILRNAIANKSDQPFYHILLSRAYGETGEKMRSFDSSGEFHYHRGNYQFALKQFAKAEFLAESGYDKARLKARIVDVKKEIIALR